MKRFTMKLELLTPVKIGGRSVRDFVLGADLAQRGSTEVKNVVLNAVSPSGLSGEGVWPDDIAQELADYTEWWRPNAPFAPSMPIEQFIMMANELVDIANVKSYSV